MQPAQGDSPDDVWEPELDELAQSLLERCRRGEEPSIDEYVLRRPELAERIRDLDPPLERQSPYNLRLLFLKLIKLG